MRLLVTLLAIASVAWSAATVAADGATARRDRAVVTIANRPIITLYGPVAGHSAQDRVDDTLARIRRVIAGDRNPGVTTRADPDGTEVLLGGRRAFLVTRIDIDPEFGETTENVAREAATRLAQAVREYAQEHTAKFLALAAFWTVLATVLFYAVVRATVAIDGRVAARLAPIAAARTEKVKLGGARVFDAAAVAAVTRRVVRAAAWAVVLVATYAWLAFALTRFPYSRPWGERMAAAVVAQLGAMATAVADAMPGLVVAVIIFVVARGIVRTARLFFDRLEAGRIQFAGLDRESVVPTRWLFAVLVYLFALGLAYPHLPGANTDAFKGLSVLVGLMLSIGGSGLAGQGLAGLILVYSRVVRPGEAVRVGDVEGTVTSIGAFTTRIQTYQDHEVLLSNSQILQTATRNYSRTARGAHCTIAADVSYGYTTPWRQAVAMLEMAARRTAGIEAHPEPFVRQTALSDFYAQYRLVAYLPAASGASRLEVLGRLYANILDVANEYGVQMMSPNYQDDPPEPQVVPRDQWYAAPAVPPQGAPTPIAKP